jgi:hypothetical protein
MKLREALVSAIETLRIHFPEDPDARRVASRLELRAEVMRKRDEDRLRTVPRDLKREAVLVPLQEINACMNRLRCRACKGGKKRGAFFCSDCYLTLAFPLRKALRLAPGKGFEQAWNRALRVLVNEEGDFTLEPRAIAQEEAA